MLMVIFGAGASYDSSPDFPPPQPRASVANYGPLPDAPDPREAWRPPVTNQLFLDPNDKFGDIVQKYPRLHGIFPFLRSPQKGRSVEQQLELYMDEAWVDQERMRQLLSVRYYLHDLFRLVSTEWLKRTNGVTNYATLIDQIRNLNRAGDPVCLVSFNYDLLLDRAVFPSGSTQPLERHFEGHAMFKVFKPHGSVEWARLVARPPLSRVRLVEEIIQQAPDLELSHQYERLGPGDDVHQVSKFNPPVVPAIAIPVQTKTEDTFEWPAGHLGLLRSILPQVEQILIIGWRGKEAHFLNLLRENLPKGGLTQIKHLQVVGRDPAEVENISKQFLVDIDRRVWKLPALHAKGFSDFVRQEQVGFFFRD